MKIALIGAGGQLSQELRPVLAAHDLVLLARADLDVCDAERVAAVLADLRPDLVVNTTAYNLVDKAETDVDDAFATNTRGARNLAKAAAAVDAGLLHFSTDYVFGLDAARSTPWSETDAPGPVSVYGL
ncbi:MAG: SDR family oxidoreductase, partial [Planctomycetia bacterium]